MHTRWAWTARGAGVAATVTDEGWKVFNDRIAIAKSELERAAKLDPSRPDPPSRLITIGMAQSLDVGGLRAYFDRAVKANPTHVGAYSRLIYAFAPRWGGSRELMFDLARKTIAAHPDEPALGFLLARAHRDVAETESVDEVAYLNQPSVAAEIDSVYAKIFERYPRADAAYLGRSELAALAGDRAGALAWVRKGAEGGGAECLYKLGEMYDLGDGVAEDPAKSFNYFILASARGHAGAQACAAFDLLHGRGTPEDGPEGVRLAVLGSMLDQPLALTELAFALIEGKFVVRDDREAVRLLEIALPKGRADTQEDPRLDVHQRPGCRSDKARARRLFMLAAAQGRDSAKKELAGSASEQVHS